MSWLILRTSGHPCLGGVDAPLGEPVVRLLSQGVPCSAALSGGGSIFVAISYGKMNFLEQKCL